MIKLLKKHKHLYLFILTLALIGLLSGYFYYKVQPSTIKDNINNQININEDLSNRTNNIPKRTKELIIYLISSITIIGELLNIFNIYYEPFELGFIFSFLKQYKLKFTIYYSLTYYLIPLIFKIILLRLTISLTYNIIKYLLTKDFKIKRTIKLYLKKYLIISLILIFYEFLIYIFSPSINTYLMTFLNN